jgi:hypothetical protein
MQGQPARTVRAGGLRKRVSSNTFTAPQADPTRSAQRRKPRPLPASRYGLRPRASRAARKPAKCGLGPQRLTAPDAIAPTRAERKPATGTAAAGRLGDSDNRYNPGQPLKHPLAHMLALAPTAANITQSTTRSRPTIRPATQAPPLVPANRYRAASGLPPDARHNRCIYIS